MTGMRSMTTARRAGALFRCRLNSRSDVKRAGRSQNRALMRGGRA